MELLHHCEIVYDCGRHAVRETYILKRFFNALFNALLAIVRRVLFCLRMSEFVHSNL